MAANPSEAIVSKTPLSNIHSDESAASRRPLPTGRCNFTNLSVGGSNQCGCLRYWDQSDNVTTPSRRSNGVSHERPSFRCFCDHHACFHEAESVVRILVPNAGDPEVIQPHSHLTKTYDSSLPSTYRAAAEKRPFDQHPSTTIDALKDGGVLEQDHMQIEGITQATLSETSRAENVISDGDGGSELPPIPSQCLLPSDISSGGFDGEPRSFSSSMGLDFQSLVNYSGNADANVARDEENLPSQSNKTPTAFELERHVSGIQVAAETLRRQVRQTYSESLPRSGTPGMAEHTASTTTVALMSSNKAVTTKMDVDGIAGPLSQVLPHLEAIHKHLATRPTLHDRIENHAKRLDFLENAFDTNADRQEVHERFEIFDDRQNELESRVDDIEKAQAAMNDVSSIGSSRRQLDIGSSMTSETSTAVMLAMSGRQELSSRVESLESRFAGLNPAALSSYTNPWEVEVVFLPFGASLKGIWSTMGQFANYRSRGNNMAADDWTQTQYSTMAKTQVTRGYHRSWEDMHDQVVPAHEWLVARACSSGSRIEERLRSRGLVRTIAVRSPGARDVHDAMSTAFGDIMQIISQGPLTDGSGRSTLPESVQRYHSLQSSWIPLRKLHKDSRLRFLDPPEMVTAAVWTAMFLSSVAMRATGVNRLYVTQRDSYIQGDGCRVNWTWQKIRELPRVDPKSFSSSLDVGFRQTFSVEEGDAREVCWEWDARLDPPPSTHSSFTSHHSSLSIRRPPVSNHQSSGSSHSSGAPSPALSTSPTSVAQGGPLSPLVERHLIRPLHSRTTSMPAMIPIKGSLSQGKRRIASFDHELASAHSSPTRPPALPLKRQRTSRSPSRPRDTPRWSVGPPSPYVDEPVEQKRGTTPFAYATPHSNAPYFDFRRRSTGPMIDDDDDPGSTTDDIGFDSDMDQDHGQEWEGVEDEMPATGEYSDQERKALSVDEADDASHASSVPSEYPVRQPLAFYSGNKGSFHIHVDEEES